MINELKRILLEKGDARKMLIQDFQNHIWNDEELPYEENVIEFLRDLAYDLDFCETDKCVDEEIATTIEKIQKLESK